MFSKMTPAAAFAFFVALAAAQYNAITSSEVMVASTAANGDVYVTSTVYKETPVTILSCAPTVSSCPAEHQTHTITTTATVPDYVTICPITASLTGVPSPTAPISAATTLGLTTAPLTTYVSGAMPSTTTAAAKTTSVASSASVSVSTATVVPVQSHSSSAPASASTSVAAATASSSHSSSMTVSSSSRSASTSVAAATASNSTAAACGPYGCVGSSTASASSAPAATIKASSSAHLSAANATTSAHMTGTAVKPSFTHTFSARNSTTRTHHATGTGASHSRTHTGTGASRSHTLTGTGASHTVGTSSKPAATSLSSTAPFHMQNSTMPAGTGQHKGTGHVTSTAHAVKTSATTVVHTKDQTVTVTLGGEHSHTVLTKTIQLTETDTIRKTIFRTMSESARVPASTSVVAHTTAKTHPVSITYTLPGSGDSTPTVVVSTLDITQYQTVYRTIEVTETAAPAGASSKPAAITSASSKPAAVTSASANNNVGAQQSKTVSGPASLPTAGSGSGSGSPNTCPASCKETITVSSPPETVFVTVSNTQIIGVTTAKASAATTIATKPHFTSHNGTASAFHSTGSGFVASTGFKTKTRSVSTVGVSTSVAAVTKAGSTSVAATTKASSSSAVPSYTAPIY